MSRPLACRAPNFTTREVEALLTNIESRPHLDGHVIKIIKGGAIQSTNELTTKDKLKIWSEIADGVNAVEAQYTGVTRTAKELKKKWSDLKSRVKIKAEDLEKGKLPKDTKFSEVEERVLNIIKRIYTPEIVENALPTVSRSLSSTNRVSSTAHIHSLSTRRKDESVDSEHEQEAVSGEFMEGTHYSIQEEEEISLNLDEPVESPVQSKEESITDNAIYNVSNVITLPLPLRKEVPQNRTQEAEDSHVRKYRVVIGDKKEDRGAQNLLESHKEIKKELKDIKRIMFRMFQQKRKRLEQEDERIQLKKMKLLLKCKELGVDYDDFITDFL